MSLYTCTWYSISMYTESLLVLLDYFGHFACKCENFRKQNFTLGSKFRGVNHPWKLNLENLTHEIFLPCKFPHLRCTGISIVVTSAIDLKDYVLGIGNGITWAHSNNTLDASRSVHSVSWFHHNCLRKTTFKSPGKKLLSSEQRKFYVFHLMSVTF